MSKLRSAGWPFDSKKRRQEIIDKGFSLFDAAMPCITDTCVSSADSKIPKRKPSTDAKLWS